MVSGLPARCFAGVLSSTGQLKNTVIELLNLQVYRLLPSPSVVEDILVELQWRPTPTSRRSRRIRKRGRRGGRVRRAFKLPFPPILLCNPRSLKNKLDELHTQAGASFKYRESGLLVFTRPCFTRMFRTISFKWTGSLTYARIERTLPGK